MKIPFVAAGLVGIAMIHSGMASAQASSATDQTPIEYIGKAVRGVPVSPAVKIGGMVFVSGTPAFDKSGKVAVGDFAAQMKQVMENVADTLKLSGTGWNRVVKMTVMLIRNSDFADMNRIYAAYFPSGNYPARTTIVVSALPSADFLLEIECQAVLE